MSVLVDMTVARRPQTDIFTGQVTGTTLHMGGCQNYGPFLGPYCNTAPNIWGTQKGAIILTTSHMRSIVPKRIPESPIPPNTP